MMRTSEPATHPMKISIFEFQSAGWPFDPKWIERQVLYHLVTSFNPPTFDPRGTRAGKTTIYPKVQKLKELIAPCYEMVHVSPLNERDTSPKPDSIPLHPNTNSRRSVVGRCPTEIEDSPL